MDLENIINNAWTNRELLKDSNTIIAIEKVIEMLDIGELRVCDKDNEVWITSQWIKKAVILYFPIRKMETIEIGPLEFHDKMKLKSNYALKGVRVVPHAIARYGSYLARNVIMMPSYVNIGAYVDSGTMVDTWATVGSCAQIGKNVHLSGGVGIGGVLEPLQASPVIIEDNAFIGSRCIIVEGARVWKEACIIKINLIQGGLGLPALLSSSIIDSFSCNFIDKILIAFITSVVSKVMKSRLFLALFIILSCLFISLIFSFIFSI